MHRGVGLDVFNELPKRKAVHALFECCNSVTMAGDLADRRPYPDRAALFRTADAVLFSLSEDSVDEILQAYPSVGSRPEAASAAGELGSTSGELASAAREYTERFGFIFVMYPDPEDCPAAAVIAAIGERMHHDRETERKVMRNEIAKFNRTRFERMLGPEGGYDNWV